MKVGLKKTKTPEEISTITKRLREEGKIIVTTNGSFDVLHAAHVHLLEKAKAEGDILIVLINSDQSIRKLKGEKRPICNEKERSLMLSAIEYVDYVVIFDSDNPLKLLEVIKPHKHVKGGSFVPERIALEQSLLSKWGGQFKSFELESGFSTTRLIDKIVESYK